MGSPDFSRSPARADTGRPTAIGAVLFDLDDTLLPTRRIWLRAVQTVAARIARAHPGYSPAAITESYLRTTAAGRTAARPSGPLAAARRAAWRCALSDIGITMPEEHVAALVDEFVEEQLDAVHPDAELLSFLGTLARHCLLGVVTNGDKEMQQAKLQRAELCGFFSTVVYGADLGSLKPDPAPFQRACEELGLRSVDCAYVGDSWAHDIIGSAGVGMRPIWISAPSRPTPDEHVCTERFSTLSEAFAYLIRTYCTVLRPCAGGGVLHRGRPRHQLPGP